MHKEVVSVFWFRRDLRLEDNAGLYHALKSGVPVLCLFIFDADILDKLDDKTDKRVLFIHQQVERLNLELNQFESSLMVRKGKPLSVWTELIREYSIQAVYSNEDYEPYAMERDERVKSILSERGILFHNFKDQVIFEKDEVVKDDGKPYTVFTPYSKKWKATLEPFFYHAYPTLSYVQNLWKTKRFPIPSLESIGFTKSEFHFPERIIKKEIISRYTEQRDFPAKEGTSHLGIHLRFGTLSIRKMLAYALKKNETFVNELIWREFYQQILFHFPHVVDQAFKPEYDLIEWVNDENQFQAWCVGRTGYPLVDAGMRELNESGFMHNRVRMVTASFLTKHLLIDWRWGEAYFAEKLLDFELASNNGGWQWAAGSGTDAAPYFRVFNPQLQLERFDPELKYVRKWVPEFGTSEYPEAIVSHDFARKRVLEVYKAALKG